MLANNMRRYWVLLTILVYSAQTFAFVGGMSMSKTYDAENAAVTVGCHGDHSNGDQMGTESVESLTCCDDGCSMMGCHATSALLSSVGTFQLKSHREKNLVIKEVLLSNISYSLYRPPIFR